MVYNIFHNYLFRPLFKTIFRFYTLGFESNISYIHIRSSEEEGRMSKYDFFRFTIIPLPSIDTMVIVSDRYSTSMSYK